MKSNDLNPDAREELITEHDVDADRLSELDQLIDETAEEYFEMYDFEPENPDECLRLLKTSIYTSVLEFTESLNKTAEDHIDDLFGDFEGDSGYSNLSFVIGRLATETKDFEQLSGEILRRNYEQA